MIWRVCSVTHNRWEYLSLTGRDVRLLYVGLSDKTNNQSMWALTWKEKVLLVFMLTLATLGHTKRQNRFQILVTHCANSICMDNDSFPLMFHTKHEVKCLYVSAVYLTRQRKIVNSLLMKLQSEWMASLRLTTCQCTHMTLEGASVCIHVCERETGPGACGTLSWRMGRYPLVIAASSGMWVLDGPGSAGRWFVVVAYPLLCVIPGRSWAFGGLGSCPQLVLGWLHLARSAPCCIWSSESRPFGDGG